ncbi:MAG: hypothetical protein A3J28_07105 [Acidobacteria bacterium RIFCSPLOWO2_12_FULL_60_22]|nr:MAG: hypothetical protein A3J28_07105 [Acidobacteria bacterium RIFCSPLOWO2_12_FULL_60_22]
MVARKLFLVLLGLILYGQLAWAQVNTATISGTVRDQSGAVLPGANVVIQNQDTGISRTVTTNTAGRYSAAALGLGNYQVTAQVQGFQSQARSGVVLTVGREAVVDFTLTVGAVTQTVEVSGEAPLVELTNANLGGLVDDRTIRDLPLNGRSYDQLALLQPGIVQYGTAGGSFNGGSGNNKFSAAGNRSYSNSFLLDGTDINDSSNQTPGGSSGTNLGVDTIREFKIVTNTFSAEYGRASGAVVSAVTRSGTNELHGSVFEFLRNSALDARNFFDVDEHPPFRRNQFGGVLGGPIQRDQTFFFAGYEGLRQALSTTTFALVPTPAVRNGLLPDGRVIQVAEVIKPYLNLWPEPNHGIFKDPATGRDTFVGEYVAAPNAITRDDYFMGRVDHQLTAATNLFGRYSFDDDSTDSPRPTGTFTNVNIARRQYVTLQGNTVFTPTLLNAFRFALNRAAQFQDDVPTDENGKTLSFIPGQPTGLIEIGENSGIGTLTNVGASSTTPRFWVYNLWEWGDDLTYVQGKHTLKWGGVARRIQSNNNVQTDVRGGYVFPTVEALLLARPSQYSGTPLGEDGYKGIRQTMFGFYGQDDFKVNQRLTLNLGLRWEMITDPTEVNHKVSNLLHWNDPEVTAYPNLKAFFETGKKNFQPRFGFAWQMDERASRVLRAGFGMYHDLLVPFYFNQQTSKYPPFYHRARIRPTASRPVPFPNAAAIIQSGDIPLVQMEPLAPFLHSPTKFNFNLSLQQQFGGRGVVEVAYVGSQARHIMRYYQINSPFYQIVNGQKFRPNTVRRNPNFDRVRLKSTDSNSHYNGLQFKVARTSTSGTQFQVTYTFSKVMDQQGGLLTADNGQRDGSTTMDPEDTTRDWGRAAHDATHNFTANFTYPVPFRFTSRAASLALGGWEITGIARLMAGQPLTPQLSFDNSRTGDSGAGDRPDLVPGKSQNPILGTPDRWYDPTAFSRPTPGTYGNLGRNTVIGPGLANFDLSLFKRFNVTENANVQFRAELFNVFNHANFGLPNAAPIVQAASDPRGWSYNPSGGRVSDTVGTNRQIQFGLKFVF